MKRVIVFIVSLFLSCYFYGQYDMNIKSSEINLRDLVPSDFDTFWSFRDGCGIPIFSNTYTYMDTFRVFNRQPFSQYLLGEYYCGRLIAIDSITAKSPFDKRVDDSIIYVYAKLDNVEQFSSPYNKEIYYSPIPEDIKYDTEMGFQYYKRLQSELNDTILQKRYVCILITKQEMMMIEEAIDCAKEVLLRSVDDSGSDSSSTVFCFQPFFSGYSKDLLMSKKQIAMYKLLRYRRLYYDLYGKENIH